MNRTRRLLLVLALLAPPAVASAHHTYAAVDWTRRLTVRGTVRTLQWTNPHIWVWVDVTDGRGHTEPYGFESLAPSELARFFGWTKRALAPGDAVTVEYAPLRSGKHGGALARVTLSDGRVLRTPSSDLQGPPPAHSTVSPRFDDAK
jgi:Family of unknown function (DUF6152)